MDKPKRLDVDHCPRCDADDVLTSCMPGKWPEIWFKHECEKCGWTWVEKWADKAKSGPAALTPESGAMIRPAAQMGL